MTDQGMKNAIVYSGGSRFVGRVLPSIKPGTVATVHDTFEIITSIVAMPAMTPDNQPTMQIGPTSVPVLIDGCDRFLDIDVFVTAVRFFDDMGKSEVAFLEKAREMKTEESKQRRMAAMGLDPAKELPKG